MAVLTFLFLGAVLVLFLVRLDHWNKMGRGAGGGNVPATGRAR